MATFAHLVEATFGRSGEARDYRTQGAYGFGTPDPRERVPSPARKSARQDGHIPIPHVAGSR